MSAEPMEPGPIKVTFGFKRTKTGKLASTAAAEVLVAEDSSKQQRESRPTAELITAIEGDQVERLEGQSAPGSDLNEPVVPLLADKRDWATAAKRRRIEAAAAETAAAAAADADKLAKASPAVLAILAECQNGGVASAGSSLTSSQQTVVELPTPCSHDNQLAQAEEEAESEVEDADYNAVAVESFGLAALRGMGFKGTADDLAREASQREVRLRPRGLGLGADSPANGRQQASQHPTASANSNEPSAEELQWKCGARCRVTIGRDAGHCGTLVSADSDASRWLVKVAQLSNQVKSYPLAALELISQRDFDKDSRVLNAARVNQYRAEQSRWGWLRAGCLVKVCADGHPHYAKRLRVVEELRDGAAGRCVDESTIENDADNSSSSSARRRAGSPIELSASDVETVVPRRRDTRVVVVRGTLAGKLARTADDAERDDGLRRRGLVRVRLRESGDLVKLGLDDVCEYRAPS